MKFDLAKVLSQRIVLLSGEESVLRRRALSELLEAASGGDDFDVEMFTGDGSSPAQWRASAGTAPFLSPKRTAVVRNVLRSKDWDQLGSAETLPETGLLILVADDEMGDEGKRDPKRLSDGWSKAVQKAKGAVLVAAIDPKSVSERLKAEAVARGKEFGPQAADALKEMCGDSLSRALDELEKLLLFIGERRTITVDDVRTVVVPSREWNIFKLIDAVLRGAVGDSLKQLRILVGSQSKADSVAYSTIFPMMSRQLRLIYQARLVLDAGGDPNRIPDSVKANFPSRPNLATEKDYPRQIAFQQAKKVSLDQVARAMGVLSDTDARMKGLLPSFTGQDALDRMVLELVDVLRKPGA